MREPRLGILSTHYCTHSIAPVMALTGRFPVALSAFEIGATGVGRELPNLRAPAR